MSAALHQADLFGLARAAYRAAAQVDHHRRGRMSDPAGGASRLLFEAGVAIERAANALTDALAEAAYAADCARMARLSEADAAVRARLDAAAARLDGLAGGPRT